MTKETTCRALIRACGVGLIMLWCSLTFLTPAHAEGSALSFISDKVGITSIFDGLFGRANNLLQQATADGSSLEEKAAVQANLSLQNADVLIKRQRGETFDQLDKESQKLLKGIAEQLDKAQLLAGKPLELEQFAFLDTQDTLNRVPFFKEKFFLTNYDGYSQRYQTSGTYSIKLTGNAFGPDTIIHASVAGVSLSPDQVDSPVKDICNISLPVNLIAEKFADTTISRIPLVIQCSRVVSHGHIRVRHTVEPFFNYTGTINCLPKYPAFYTLQENASVPDWQNAGEVTGVVTCIKTGRQILEPHRGDHFEVITHIPATWRIDPNRATRRDPDPPPFAAEWEGNPTVTAGPEGEVAIQQSISYRVHDTDHDMKLIVPVQKPTTFPATYQHVLLPFPGSTGSTTLSTTINGQNRNYLSYGAFKCDFSQGFQNYTLVMTFFNGQEITDTSGIPGGSPHLIVQATDQSTSKYIEVRAIP